MTEAVRVDSESHRPVTSGKPSAKTHRKERGRVPSRTKAAVWRYTAVWRATPQRCPAGPLTVCCRLVLPYGVKIWNKRRAWPTRNRLGIDSDGLAASSTPFCFRYSGVGSESAPSRLRVGSESAPSRLRVGQAWPRLRLRFSFGTPSPGRLGLPSPTRTRTPEPSTPFCLQYSPATDRQPALYYK
jgi:hypothetical protein